MSEMIERVARAMRDADYRHGVLWEEYKPLARAAIKAMREPTEAMVEAGINALCDCEAPVPISGRREVVTAIYRAKIDAALEEA